MPTHIAHICLCLQPHKANPKAKSKESNFPTLYQNHQTNHSILIDYSYCYFSGPKSSKVTKDNQLKQTLKPPIDPNRPKLTQNHQIDPNPQNRPLFSKIDHFQTIFYKLRPKSIKTHKNDPKITKINIRFMDTLIKGH